MKRVGLLLVSLFAVTAVSAQAGKDMYVSIGGGAQVYISESIEHGSLGKHMTPEIHASFGYWFHDLFAVQFQYDGFSSRGYLTYREFDNQFIYGCLEDDHYKQRFNYLNLHADLVFNMLKAINPKHSGVYDLLPYAGFGYAAAFKKHADSEHSYSINGGLINSFHVTDALDLNLTLRAKIVKDGFNGLKAGTRLEGSLGATVGVAYKF